MSWMERRTFGAESIPTLTAMRSRKDATSARVAVVVTADPGEPTVPAIRTSIESDLMDATGLADSLVVAEITEAGRGEALWRTLRSCDADILVWLDGGIRNYSPRVVARLLAPLLLEDSLLFLKGFTTRISPKSGGPVDSGLARPLLAALYPELGAFVAPFSREGAARTSLLRSLPFVAGEGVETGLLIDAFQTAGLDSLGQADLGGSLHRTRPVSRYDGDLARTILRRAEERGRKRAFADASVYPLLVRDQASSLPDLPPLVPSLTRRRAGSASRLAGAAN